MNSPPRASADALARSLELELPASALSLTLWDQMIARGWGDLDHSALIKLIEAGARSG